MRNWFLRCAGIANAVVMTHCAAGASSVAGDGGEGVEASTSSDASVDLDTSIVFGDAGVSDSAPSPRFFILVTETPAGSPPMSSWGGILRYDIADDAKPAVAKNGAEGGPWVDRSLVADPIALAFRQTTAEVFVGNRRANTDGSITRFTYAKTTESLSPTSTTAMSDGAGGVNGLAFSHDETELFAARQIGQISRFKFDSNGIMSPNGAITGLGSMLGVAVSKNGKRLYATQQSSSSVREFELPGGTEITGFQIPGATRPHLLVMDPMGKRLYVSDIQSNKIYVLAIDGNDDLSLAQAVQATNPISVAVSPSGKELFSTSHNFSPPDVIERFSLDPSNTWISEGAPSTIATNTALGGTLVFLASESPHVP